MVDESLPEAKPRSSPNKEDSTALSVPPHRTSSSPVQRRARPSPRRLTATKRLERPLSSQGKYAKVEGQNPTDERDRRREDRAAPRHFPPSPPHIPQCRIAKGSPSGWFSLVRKRTKGLRSPPPRYCKQALLTVQLREVFLDAAAYADTFRLRRAKSRPSTMPWV